MPGTSYIIILMLMNIKNNLVLRACYYPLSYIEGILKTYISVIIFGLIAVLVIGTELENVLIGILAITPGVGLGKGGNFKVDMNGVFLFFLVWGAIFTVFSEVINRFAEIKISFESKTLLLFGLALHSVSLLVFSFRFNFSFAVLFIGVCFSTFLLSMFFLRKIYLYKEAIYKLQENS